MVNGKPQFTDFVMKNPDGLSKNDALRSLGAMPSIAFVVDPNAITLSGLSPEIIKLNDANKAIMTQAYPHYDMPHSPDEDAVFNKYFNDINTFQNEHLFNFIVGKEPLTGFDAYVQKMYDIGLDKVLATEQMIFNRFKSFQKM